MFLANCLGQPPRSELFRNNGDLTFSEVAEESGFHMIRDGEYSANSSGHRGISFGDYDNDGDLDIFGVNSGVYFNWQYHPHNLYENNGDGTYTEIGMDAGTPEWEFGGWGSSFEDFDNDGDADIFVAGSYSVGLGLSADDYAPPSPGYLLINNGDKTFSSAETFDLTDHLVSGVSSGDYDNDGHVDLVIVTTKHKGGDGRPVLLHNNGSENAWITVKTTGTTSNRDGIGAHVTVKAGDLLHTKEVRAGSGFLGANSLWQTFGLGDREGPVDITVRWPSGLVETFLAQETRQKVTLTEGTGRPG